MESDLLRLKGVLAFFQDLTEEAWQDMKDLFSYADLPKGEYLVKEGEYTHSLAFVLEGVLRAVYLDKEGNYYNKTFFMENALAVSLASVLQRVPSALSFEALVKTRILVANYYEVSSLFDKHPCVERLVRKFLEYKWIKKEQREIRLVLNDATENYAFFQQEYPGLENRIPQYHIASHLGITPIQLSRIRAKQR